MSKKKRTAFDGAYDKGHRAFTAGRPISSCPYKDRRGDWHNMVTFSRGFIRAWEDGWNDAKKGKHEREDDRQI